MTHDSSIVTFPYTPRDTEVGHSCLFARAYSYSDFDMPDSGDAFSTRTDRHIGQQNLFIVDQGTDFEFNVSPDEKDNVELKVTQRKTPVRDFKVRGVENLRTTTKTIALTRLVFLKNTEPIIGRDGNIFNFKELLGKNNLAGKKDNTKLDQKNTRKLIASKLPILKPIPIQKPTLNNWLKKLLALLFSSLFKQKVDTTKFKRIDFNTNGVLNQRFEEPINKIKLQIPCLFLSKNLATTFDIEMVDKKTGESRGGITVIVKS